MLKKNCLVLVALFFILIFSTHASATTLWDQPLSIINTQPYFNQAFVPADPSDSWLADDFVNEATWEINKIVVPGDFWYIRYYSNLLNATMLHWYIYEDDGGQPSGYPGNPTVPFWSISLAPNDAQVVIEKGTENLKSNVTLNLDTPITLTPAGTYWLIFYPEVRWLLVGGHGRQFSDTANGSPAQYIMPGDGSPEPLPDVWTSVLDIAWKDYNLDPLTQKGTSQQDLAFRLEGSITDANIEVDPATIVFSNTLVDVASTQETVTISNPGLSDLTINTVTITGASASDFAVAPGDTDGCALTGQVLTSGDFCTLSVTFTPSAAGNVSASLEIASDATNANLIRVNLVGFGVEALPSVTEGTIGTEITFTASPSTFGTKKGKVLIQNEFFKSTLKIAKVDWSDTEITGTVKKALESGQYNIQISVPPYRTTTPIDISGGFTFKKPEVDPLTDSDGAPGEEIEVTGKFFGSKKPKVYLEYTTSSGVEKKKNCRVKSFTWIAQTGVSSLVFIVPKGLEAGVQYPLRVETKKVGTSVDEIFFTILSPPG